MAIRPFGLRDDPFVEGHDRRLIYPHRSHRENVERLSRALEQHVSFALLTGASGTGKTSVLLTACAGAKGARCVELKAGPAFGIDELCTHLLAGLGVEATESVEGAAPAERLATALAARPEDSPALVLAIDEAQDLSDAMLEELRLLSNVEAHGHRALCIVLSGAPALEQRLDEPRHQALRQRIAARCRLEPMSARETEAFLHHRVTVCGGPGALFPRAACRAVHALTHGVAREVQLIAGEAIAQAHAAASRTVEPAHVAAAASQLGFRSVIASTPTPARKAEPEARANVGAAADANDAAGAESHAETPAEAVEAHAAPAAPAEAAGTTEAAAQPQPVTEPESVVAPEPPPPAPNTSAPAAAAAAKRAAPAPPTPPVVTSPAPAHPEAVEAWLARFRDQSGPPRIGARVAAEASATELAHPPKTSRVSESDTPEPASSAPTHADTSDSNAAETTDEVPPPAPARRPRRKPGRVVGRTPLKPSRFARRRHIGRWIAAALVVATLGALALLRGHRPARQASWFAPTDTAVTPSSARGGAPHSALPVAPLTRTVASTPTVPVTRVPIVAPPSGRSAAAAIKGNSGARPAGADTATAAPRRYLIVVGSYLVAERAYVERDRVAARTPYPCHVLRGYEDGAEVYRIMVGPLPSRHEADHVGEELFASGAVSEARVVRWHGGPLAPR